MVMAEGGSCKCQCKCEYECKCAIKCDDAIAMAEKRQRGRQCLVVQNEELADSGINESTI